MEFPCFDAVVTVPRGDAGGFGAEADDGVDLGCGCHARREHALSDDSVDERGFAVIKLANECDAHEGVVALGEVFVFPCARKF